MKRTLAFFATLTALGMVMLLPHCAVRQHLRPPNAQVKTNESSVDFSGALETKAFLTLSAQKQLHQYASECERVLGSIPKLNCSSGKVIPVRLTAADGKSMADYSFPANWEPQKIVADRSCDKPSGLMLHYEYGQCTPFSRIGRAPAEPGYDTQWVFVCRRYYDRPESSPYFDDVNIIGYSPSSGATCFFNSKVPERKPPTLEEDFGNNVEGSPHPLDADSVQFFQTLQEVVELNPCISCHSSQPWLHSPYVGQVRWQGQAVVPPNDKGAPYFPLAWRYLEAYGGKGSWTPRYLTSRGASPCAGCHRIGDRNYCKEYVPIAAGMPSLESYRKVLSASHSQFPLNNWHFQPGHPAMATKGQPKSWDHPPWSDALSQIAACCQENQDDEKCDWQPVEGPAQGK